MPAPPDSAGCRRTLFRISLAPFHAVPGITQVFTDLENPVTTTQIEWTPPGNEESDTKPFDTRLVRDVICDNESLPEVTERSVQNIDVEPFWRGALPESDHKGTFVSLGISYGRGQPNPPMHLPIVTDESQTMFVDQPPHTPGTTQTIAREANDIGGAGTPPTPPPPGTLRPAAGT